MENTSRLHIRLRNAIKKRGLKRVYIAEDVLLISRPTLNTRLKDGGMTQEDADRLYRAGILTKPKSKKK